ncbi:hypothetical protein ACFLYO_11205, partial [Chloroflexota bacterium]
DIIAQAHAAGQTQELRMPLTLLVMLFERYNAAHIEDIDLEEQETLVALYEQARPVAKALEDAVLITGLCRAMALALNTLGNHHATADNHEAAIATYTKALEQSPEIAMLYRNRAGEYIELGQLAAAQTDIEAAQRLEPDAERLSELLDELEKAQNDQEKPDA